MTAPPAPPLAGRPAAPAPAAIAEPVTACYRFPDDRVRIVSHLPGALAELDRVFGRFRSSSTSQGVGTGDTPDFVIRRAGSSPVVVRTGADGDVRSVLLSGGGLLPGLEREIHRRLVARVAPPRLALHAAVVAIGSGAVLLPGDSGDGKSTLAAALTAAGATYLGDELALLDPDPTGGELAIPFPKAVTLKPGSFALFPDAGPAEPVGRAEPVWYLDPERLRPGCVAHRALPVVAVVLPGHDPAAFATRWTTPTTGTVALALIRAAVGLPRHGEPGLDRLIALAASARLLAASYPDATAAADALLERLATPIDPLRRRRPPR